MHACKGHKPPRDAYLAVKYRGYWYFIDDRDDASKKTFALVLMLSRLDFGLEETTGAAVPDPAGGRDGAVSRDALVSAAWKAPAAAFRMSRGRTETAADTQRGLPGSALRTVPLAPVKPPKKTWACLVALNPPTASVTMKLPDCSSRN